MVFDGSGPGDARARERLTDDRIGWLTTVTSAGQPQSMPVWFLWAGDEILVFSDHRARRNRNIAANPRVSFHLGSNASGGDIVVVEGEARIDHGVPGPEGHAAYFAKYGDWIDAYLGGAAKMAETYNVPIVIRPVRGVAFGG
jgi:PPOX class probable F420-dependent enzyme